MNVRIAKVWKFCNFLQPVLCVYSLYLLLLNNLGFGNDWETESEFGDAPRNTKLMPNFVETSLKHSS